MDFKEWLSEDQMIIQEVEKLLNGLKMQALNSMHVTNKKVAISMKAAQPAFALAAHYVPEGPAVTEHDWENRHNKGYLALNAASKFGDVQQNLGWDKKQQNSFKRGFHSRVQKIATPLGFLFEAEVFMSMLNEYSLHDGDNGEMQVNTIRTKFLDQIKAVSGHLAEQILQLTALHAKDLAGKIVDKTKRILGCVDMVWFNANTNSNWSGRGNPADIMVGCSEVSGERDRVGYSLKFGSETKINVASFANTQLVSVLGLKGKAAQDLIAAEDEHESIRKLFIAIQPKFEKNPKEFVKFLNLLLAGKQFTFPAPRNYASPDMGGPDWSANIKKDFLTSDRSPTLRPRDDATVFLDFNSSYVRMTYKVLNGSASGTSIFLLPRNKTFNVKVTNLTSERR